MRRPRIARLRPFLVLLAVALLAQVVTVLLPGYVSYDTGWIWTPAVLVNNTIGQPFHLPAYLFDLLNIRGHVAALLIWPLGLASGTLLYAGLDRLSQRWVSARDTPAADIARDGT